MVYDIKTVAQSRPRGMRGLSVRDLAAQHMRARRRIGPCSVRTARQERLLHLFFAWPIVLACVLMFRLGLLALFEPSLYRHLQFTPYGILLVGSICLANLVSPPLCWFNEVGSRRQWIYLSIGCGLSAIILGWVASGLSFGHT